MSEDEYAGVRKLAVPTFPLPSGRGGVNCGQACVRLAGTGWQTLSLGELRGLMAKPSYHTELSFDETSQERMS